MRSHRLNRYLALAIVLAFALQVLPVEWERGEALSNSVTLDVPYHMEVNPGYSGEAALEMLFDYWGEDIPQQEIRNVTGDVVDAAEPEDLIRAAHFSSESRAKLNPTQMGYSERMFGYGYAAFHYNWGREGVSTSPRFNQRFDDLRSVLDEGYPIILYMRESAANPLKKTYRVLIGYDLTTNEFILHDPLPQGTGDLGGESVRVSPADLDRLWNVSGGMRWGMIAVAWQFDLHYPLQVDAGEEFTVEVDVNYPCPDPFPKNQYPISGQIRIELQMNENFTLLSQSWEEGIQMGGDWGKALLNIKAPERGMDQIYTIYVGVGGEISGTTAAGRSYKDIIGGTTSFGIKVKGYVNHPPEISRAWIAPQEVLRDGESQITLYCSAEDVDGDLVGVEVDLQRLGGYTHQRLYDDGTHGDETPGDGVYSLLYTVPRGAEEGNITVTFTAFDAAGATATATASVEVKDPYTSTSPPVIVRTGFTPPAAPPDGYTEVRIWARVMDPEGDIDRVYADMTPIGGKKVTILRDDGAGGDLIPADGNYTYLFTIPPTIAYGVYNITVKAEDVPGHDTKRTAILTVIPSPEPPKLSQVRLNRTSVPNDGVTPVLLTARVKDPNNDVSEVFADLSEVGGDRRSKMYDDGTHGDLIPSDRVYSVVFTVPKNVRPGRKSIEVTAKDSEGGVARTRVTLQVTSANTPPEIITLTLPQTPLPADGKTKGVVKISVSDPDNNVVRVYLNISTLNLTVDLHDDGKAPDKTASDGVWTGYIIIPKGTKKGEYQGKAVVLDSYGDSTELDFTLEVKEVESATSTPSSIYIWVGLILFALILAVAVLRRSGKKAQTPPPPQGPPAFVPVSEETPVFKPVR